MTEESNPTTVLSNVLSTKTKTFSRDSAGYTTTLLSFVTTTVPSLTITVTVTASGKLLSETHCKHLRVRHLVLTTNIFSLGSISSTSTPCTTSSLIRGADLIESCDYDLVDSIISILMDEDMTKNLASDNKGYRKVAQFSIFECKDDGSLAYNQYCHRGITWRGSRYECV